MVYTVWFLICTKKKNTLQKYVKQLINEIQKEENVPQSKNCLLYTSRCV